MLFQTILDFMPVPVCAMNSRFPQPPGSPAPEHDNSTIDIVDSDEQDGQVCDFEQTIPLSVYQ